MLQVHFYFRELKEHFSKESYQLFGHLKMLM